MPDKENERQYKLKTRRYLAWAVAIPITLTLCFGLVYGLITQNSEAISVCSGILGTAIGAIIGFYFKSKVEEE